MKNKNPCIELYMYSLNQEFLGHHSFIKTMSDTKQDVSGSLVNIASSEMQVFNSDNSQVNDCAVHWVSNEWIKNYTKDVGLGQYVVAQLK